jgi:hypothetical protein
LDWGIVYYADEQGRVPAEEFLDSCPSKIDARFNAVLEAVRAAPPPSFSGGGYWEAMHGEMGGYYEIRLTGPGRRQHRLFCLLDSGSDAELAERGFDEPKIAVLPGWSSLPERSSRMRTTAGCARWGMPIEARSRVQLRDSRREARHAVGTKFVSC